MSMKGKFDTDMLAMQEEGNGPLISTHQLHVYLPALFTCKPTPPQFEFAPTAAAPTGKPSSPVPHLQLRLSSFRPFKSSQNDAKAASEALHTLCAHPMRGEPMTNR